MTRWAPPDWRDAGAYRDWRAVSLDRVATEFLIRNAEFRREYEGAKHDRQACYALLHRYGVRSPNLREWGRDSPFAFHRPPYQVHSLKPINDRPELVAFVFDLRYSIDKQIDRAKSVIKAYTPYAERSGLRRAPKVQRAGRADYGTLLRILDARDSGASYGVIAEVLFPRRESGSARDLVKKLAREAGRLRDGGYRDLPTLSDSPKPGNARPRA